VSGLPLSAMQEAFWFHEALAGDGGRRAAVAFGVDFEPAIALDRLDRALTAVVRRHPLLRARFALAPAGPALVVEEAPDSILTRLPADAAALGEWWARPVSMLDWPLCRAAAAVDAARTRLRVVVHHAVFDAQSKDVFLRDLLRAYTAPERASGPARGDSVAFWHALLERERSRAGEPAEAATEWTRRGPAPADATCDSLRFEVEPGLMAIVGDAAGRLGVSTFSVALTAWHAALARLCFDAEDIVTPIALSTRRDADAGEIGPFLNQLPVRSAAPRSRSFRAVALELAETVRRLAADRHQRPPASGDPVGAAPEVSVSYRRDALGAFAWPDAAATPIMLPPLHAASADVVVRMVRRGAAISGALDVDGAVRPPGFGRRLERCWRALLRTGAQRLDARIGELALSEAA
jgi:condensation domain-containing protein